MTGPVAEARPTGQSWSTWSGVGWSTCCLTGPPRPWPTGFGVIVGSGLSPVTLNRVRPWHRAWSAADRAGRRSLAPAVEPATDGRALARRDAWSAPAPAAHPGSTVRPGAADKRVPRSRAELAASTESRARWQAHYDEVRHRIAAGEPLLTISRRMGLARGTVRKFAEAKSFPELAIRPPGPSILDPHIDYLGARLASGCENAISLWRGLRERGFTGTAKQFHRWLDPRRTTRLKHTPHRGGGAPSAAPSAAGDSAPALPSPKQLAWSLTRPRDRLPHEEDAAVARLEQDAEGATVAAPVRRLADLLRSCSVSTKTRCAAPLTTFEGWLADAKSSGVAAVTTFAAGLQQDGAAVKARSPPHRAADKPRDRWAS